MSLSFHLLASSGQASHLTPALVCRVRGIYIIRTLDPELPHQISVARIFTCAGLSIVEGLVKNNLDRGVDYFTDLGFSGPNLFEIWTPVSKARSIISAIWPTQPPPELIDLTAPALDKCWTLYDITRSSLLHNWRISTVSPEAYSTAILLRSVFGIADVVHYGEKTSYVRTGLPLRSNRDDQHQDHLDVITIKWSVNAVERFLRKHRGEEELGGVETDWIEPMRMIHEMMRVPMYDHGLEAANSFEITMADSCERLLRQLIVGSRPKRKKSTKATKPALVTTSTQTDARKEEYRDVACQTSFLPVVSEQSDGPATSSEISIPFVVLCTTIMLGLLNYLCRYLIVKFEWVFRPH